MASPSFYPGSVFPGDIVGFQLKKSFCEDVGRYETETFWSAGFFMVVAVVYIRPERERWMLMLGENGLGWTLMNGDRIYGWHFPLASSQSVP